MPISATAGSHISIGTTASSPVGDTYEEIHFVENIGEFGDEATLITGDVIEQARTFKMKGTRNAGSLALVCFYEAADEGQQDVIAAEASALSYNFKIELNDAPPGVGSTNTIAFFKAKVMSARISAGGANDPVRLQVTLELDSAVTVEPADVAGP